MTTWAQLLADIRTDLKDQSATSPKWSDATLYLYTKDAIRDYSTHFPMRVDRAAVTINEDGSYTLPTNLLRIVEVEYPENTYLEHRQSRPGVTYQPAFSTAPKTYSVYGGRLILDGSPTDPVLLTYEARHAIPADASDDTMELTVPEDDEELIRLYVCAKAVEQLRAQQSSLDRFKPGSGARDDNPLLPESRALMHEYRYKVSIRIGGGTIKLYRTGRHR